MRLHMRSERIRVMNVVWPVACACICVLSAVASTFDETDDPWSYSEDEAGGPDGVYGFNFANKSEINKFNDDGWDANGESDEMVATVSSLVQAGGGSSGAGSPRVVAVRKKRS